MTLEAGRSPSAPIRPRGSSRASSPEREADRVLEAVHYSSAAATPSEGTVIALARQTECRRLS
eukprot:10354863-Alexandrium_andersonii.AAC.1